MRHSIAIVPAILALSGLVAGCERKEDPLTTQAPAPAPVPAVEAAVLGSSVTKGHFEVNLKSEPSAPKVDRTKFIANVGHHGQPATDVRVKLELVHALDEHGRAECRPGAYVWRNL